MKKTKTGLVILTFLALGGLTAAGIISAQDNPLEGKIIALDAGHGGDDLGAVNKNCGVAEKDVNLAVVYDLKRMLEAVGAHVVLTRECNETISSRKGRVKIAKDKCAELDLDNNEETDNGECDVLVSVHHNGSTDSTRDGTMAIYNHKEDFVLAEALHDALIDELKLANEGYDHGGYGMTVYFTPASITEGYYVTNQCEAELFLNGTVSDNEVCPANIYGGIIAEPNTTVFECNANDTSRKFNYGYNRVNQEANALYQGLFNYFSSENSGGGGKPDNPGKGHKK